MPSADAARTVAQAQVDAAATEIEQARAELSKNRSAAQGELNAARTALAALSAPPSPTPLADRLGMPAWLLDLVHSASAASPPTAWRVGSWFLARISPTGHEWAERRMQIKGQLPKP